MMGKAHLVLALLVEGITHLEVVWGDSLSIVSAGDSQAQVAYTAHV